jgi:hypothetical protein
MAADDFQVGGHYENYKGVYEVLSVDDGRMTIRWDDTGDEIDTTPEMQGRIIARIEAERRDRARSARGQASSDYGQFFCGLQEQDFREGPTGTRWRRKQQLGGEVTRLLEEEGLVFQSWAIYRWQMVHWADVSHRQKAPAWHQAKFMAVVGPAELSFGLYIERADSSEDVPEDWKRFISWLRVRENEEALSRTMVEHGLVLRDLYAGFDERIEGQADGGWAVTGADGVTHQETGFLCEFLARLPADPWVNLVILRTIDRESALARGKAIAGDIAEVFGAFGPLYRAVVGI